jgi:hypothetical protein
VLQKLLLSLRVAKIIIMAKKGCEGLRDWNVIGSGSKNAVLVEQAPFGTSKVKVKMLGQLLSTSEFILVAV